MKLPRIQAGVMRLWVTSLAASPDRVRSQAGESCHICCGYIWETCCEVNCPPGQVAFCNCQNTPVGSYPRCRCV